MAKRNDANDAVNAAISGIMSVCAVVYVVFWRDGRVRLGDIFQEFIGFADMVVQNANAAEPIAPIGFKDCNVMHVGPDGAALDQDK